MKEQKGIVKRCVWANPKNPLYIKYHDEEWGRPLHDDDRLLELLILESFQAGLSWECILNKREAFRKAFAGFDRDSIIAFDEIKNEELMNTPGFIRNRRKIEAAATGHPYRGTYTPSSVCRQTEAGLRAPRRCCPHDQ